MRDLRYRWPRIAAIVSAIVGIITLLSIAGWFPPPSKADVEARMTRGEFAEFKAGLNQRLDGIDRALERIESAVTRRRP